MGGIRKFCLGAAAAAAAFGFASCENGAADAGTSVVEEYEYAGSMLPGQGTSTVKFFSDKTVAIEFTAQSITVMKFTGTYTGDPKKDSAVKISWEKAYQTNGAGGLIDVSSSYSYLPTVEKEYKISARKIAETDASSSAGTGSTGGLSGNGSSGGSGTSSGIWSGTGDSEAFIIGDMIEGGAYMTNKNGVASYTFTYDKYRMNCWGSSNGTVSFKILSEKGEWNNALFEGATLTIGGSAVASGTSYYNDNAKISGLEDGASYTISYSFADKKAKVVKNYNTSQG